MEEWQNKKHIFAPEGKVCTCWTRACHLAWGLQNQLQTWVKQTIGL